MAAGHRARGQRARTSERGREVAFALVVCAAIFAQPVISIADSSGFQYAVVTSSRNEIDVRWQARVKDTGHFRLLRGADLLSMEVINEQPSRGGAQRYRYTDPHRVGDGCLYQLRYVDHNGREVYLGTVFCREAGAGPTPALPVVHHEVVELSPGSALLGPEPTDNVSAEPRTRELPWNLIPPVPPPETRRRV